MQDWLLKLIQCPITHEPLQLADPELVARLHNRQRDGQLFNRQGVSTTYEFQAGLVNNSKHWFYPIVDDIPTLIPDESIPL